MTFVRNCGRNGPIAVTVLVALLLLSACGSHTANSQLSTAPISISLNLGNVPVNPLQPRAALTATIYDQTGGGVLWTITPPSFGTLSEPTTSTQVSGVSTSSITYTAPSDFAVPTTLTLTATSITNPDISASANINASPTFVNVQSGQGIPFAPQTVNQGEILFMRANVNPDDGKGVTWTLLPATGAGSIQPSGLNGIEYDAPATVSAPIVAQVTAASVSHPTATTTVSITVYPSGAGTNVAVAQVDGGPVAGRTHVNGAYTTVTLCNPGGDPATVVCQVVDHVLVDTGSYGLRILQSQIPFLKLPKLADNHGNVLTNCAALPNGSYLWGPVSKADVYIAGEGAINQFVQVITTSNTVQVPNSCSNGGPANANTPELLGANGILGIGPEPTDCTVAGKNYCDASIQAVPPNLYYSCPAAGCSILDIAVNVSAAQQVSNPVFSFIDKNGVILDLPPVTSPQTGVQGTLTFGIGTLPNNQLGTATILTADDQGYFKTLYNGQNLDHSFLDSGAPALFFPDSIQACGSSTGFFCPRPSLTGLSATNDGATQGTSFVSFSVDNADDLFSTYSGYAAVPNLAGPQTTKGDCSQGGAGCTFDWGLPFFYGRRVYTAVDLPQPSGLPKGPWWAY